MTAINVSAERLVDAPADIVYHCIADYAQHHNPNGFLPPAFSDFVVDQGGVGAGTVIRFNVTMAGQTRPHLARVSEPEPGRVLVETEDADQLQTTFTVEPAGEQTRVRFDTVYHRSGPMGFLEALLVPRMLRPLYVDEMARLERLAQVHGPIGACATPIAQGAA
jgi:hypothetical protein